ncbi:MAG: heavy metal translocating P-type ATPase, partial [Planctomycetota bacterium]
MPEADHAEGHGGGHDHREHHKHMAADFRRRFWISLALTAPVLVLSPMIQGWFGLADRLAFPGDRFVQFAIATVIFFYGGWPFLTGFVGELRQRQPGMMTLIALAVTVAYVYSSLVVFGLPGKVFFWELASLIVV